jgi:hypothetical protein
MTEDSLSYWMDTNEYGTVVVMNESLFESQLILHSHLFVLHLLLRHIAYRYVRSLYCRSRMALSSND